MAKPKAKVRASAKAKPRGTEAAKAQTLASIRALCAAFPQTSERPSHGSATWFVGAKRSFASVGDNHHGDGRFALSCAAPPGALAMLVESDPDVYFVPPYVAHLGWIGVHLDRAPWPMVAAALEQAYLVRAPAKLAAQLRAHTKID